MATDVTPPPTRRRASGRVDVHVSTTAPRGAYRGHGPAAPELLAFVKALARDLAKADAEAIRHHKQADRISEDACEAATSYDPGTRT